MEGQLEMATVRYNQHKREYAALAIKLVEDKETIRKIEQKIALLGEAALLLEQGGEIINGNLQ